MLKLETVEEKLKKEQKVFQTKVRVIYADTDKMGVVYHARYLNYFEIGRNEMLREINLSYKSLEAQNIYLPVIEMGSKFYKPAFYDDLLTVKTSIKKASLSSIRFSINCLIYRQDELLVSGFTEHIFSDCFGKPTRVKKEIKEELINKLV